MPRMRLHHLLSLFRSTSWLLAALALIAGRCADSQDIARARFTSPSRPPERTSEIPLLPVKLVRAYPHDPHSFTQGLEYYRGYLYESTGIAGQSTLRKVILQTGKVLQKINLPSQYFGEGLTIFHGKIYQLTWLSKKGFI